MRNGKRVHGSASARVRYSQLADATVRGRLREITHMQSAVPGQGHASALLDSICAEADADGITLVVHVAPFGDCRMTALELGRWYARKGFKAIQPEPLVMMR